MPIHTSVATGRTALALFAALLVSQCSGKDRNALPEELRDLPLVELPVPEPSLTMAFVMSGDGNWADFVRELSDTLAARGIPVVGLESRAYLSSPKTPRELGRDMERVLRYYRDAWGAENVIVVGYSRGADFAPFMVNRVSADLRKHITLVGLLSPTKMASFEFHLSDLVRYTPRASDVSPIPQVDALDMPVVCVYGTHDKDTLCPLLPPGLARIVAQDAGHRLRSPGEVADTLLGMAKRARSAK